MAFSLWINKNGGSSSCEQETHQLKVGGPHWGVGVGLSTLLQVESPQRTQHAVLKQHGCCQKVPARLSGFSTDGATDLEVCADSQFEQSIGLVSQDELETLTDHPLTATLCE